MLANNWQGGEQNETTLVNFTECNDPSYVTAYCNGGWMGCATAGETGSALIDNSINSTFHHTSNSIHGYS